MPKKASKLGHQIALRIDNFTRHEMEFLMSTGKFEDYSQILRIAVWNLAAMERRGELSVHREEEE